MQVRPSMAAYGRVQQGVSSRSREHTKKRRTRWWEPKAGERITAGIFGASFAQDSFTSPTTTTSVVASQVARFSTFGSAAPTQPPSTARNNVVASNLASRSELPASPTVAGTAAGVAAASDDSTRTNDPSQGQEFLSLDERLGVLEEAWGSRLLEARFDQPIVIATQVRSLPVLRQQPAVLVVQTRTVVASCRLDLGGLPPMTASPATTMRNSHGTGCVALDSPDAAAALKSEMHFELPLIRNGLTVGCVTGELMVAPAPLQAERSASRTSMESAANGWRESLT